MSESATFIRHYITIYLLILAVERLYRILRSSLCGKRKGEQKEFFTGGRIIRPDGYFVGGHFFYSKRRMFRLDVCRLSGYASRV